MAETAAEYLHQKVRKEYWGYTEEEFSNEELIKENTKEYDSQVIQHVQIIPKKKPFFNF